MSSSDLHRRLRSPGAGRAGSVGVGRQYWAGSDRPDYWDHASDPSDLVFNDFLARVARMRALDPVTSGLVRLRGRRSTTAGCASRCARAARLDAGGSETLYEEI